MNVQEVRRILPLKNFFRSKPIPPTLGCKTTASTNAPATPRRTLAARNLESLPSKQKSVS